MSFFLQVAAVAAMQLAESAASSDLYHASAQYAETALELLSRAEPESMSQRYDRELAENEQRYGCPICDCPPHYLAGHDCSIRLAAVLASDDP